MSPSTDFGDTREDGSSKGPRAQLSVRSGFGSKWPAFIRTAVTACLAALLREMIRRFMSSGTEREASNAQGIALEYSDEAAVYGTWRNVIVCQAYAAPSLTNAHHYTALIERVARQGKGWATLLILRPGATPQPEIRDIFLDTFRTHRNSMLGASFVLRAQGFAAAVQRSVISAILMAIGSRNAMQTFATEAEAAAWLARSIAGRTLGRRRSRSKARCSSRSHSLLRTTEDPRRRVSWALELHRDSSVRALIAESAHEEAWTLRCPPRPCCPAPYAAGSEPRHVRSTDESCARRSP